MFYGLILHLNWHLYSIIWHGVPGFGHVLLLDAECKVCNISHFHLHRLSMEPNRSKAKPKQTEPYQTARADMSKRMLTVNRLPRWQRSRSRSKSTTLVLSFVACELNIFIYFTGWKWWNVYTCEMCFRLKSQNNKDVSKR